MAILPILTAIAIDYKSDPRLFLPASFHPVCATIYIGLSIHQVDALAFRPYRIHPIPYRNPDWCRVDRSHFWPMREKCPTEATEMRWSCRSRPRRW